MLMKGIVLQKGVKVKKGRFSLEEYERELKRRAACYKGWYAAYICSRLMQLYSREYAHKHTGYFNANWNVSLGSPDFSLYVNGIRGWEPQPEVDGEFANSSLFNSEIASHREQNSSFIDESAQKDAFLEQSLYVANGVWYGKWLRDGLRNSDIFGSALTPGYEEDQRAQMEALGDKRGNEFINFQEYTLGEIRKLKTGALRMVKREGQNQPASRTYVKARS